MKEKEVKYEGLDDYFMRKFKELGIDVPPPEKKEKSKEKSDWINSYQGLM